MLFATAEVGRSKLLFAGLTLGAGLLIFVLLFQQALLAAVLDGMAGAVKKQTGEVIVMHGAARRTFGVGTIEARDAEKVAQIPGVAEVGRMGQGLFSYEPPRSDELVNVTGIGFEPGKPGTPTGLVAGRLPTAANEVVASAEGAVGRFGVGDSLTFEPGDMTLVVVGMTEGSLLNIGPAIWIPWPSYERLWRDFDERLAKAEIRPAALAVRPAEGISAQRLADDISAELESFDALTREQAAVSQPSRGPIQAAFLAVMILCYLVVSVVIGFFFLTLTLQKEPSITLLRAVGANAGYLVGNLLYEVAIVIAGGLVIGVASLIAVKPLIRQFVIINIDPAGIAATVTPALLVALLGAVPPIRRVLRTDPNHAVTRQPLGAGR